MRMEMEIGGVRFRLDPSAVSVIRYRAQYGESTVNDLPAAATPKEAEGLLLRMCHLMIVEADRPELLDFARLARRDSAFRQKALKARRALLAVDPLAPRRNGEKEKFDEYNILALMAAAGVDMQLIYELPIMHIVSVIGRLSDMRDTGKKTRRLLTEKEMAQLYPK